MKTYNEYVKKLNFKQFEATNCFAYELIMRNTDAQKSIKILSKTIKKLLSSQNELFRFDKGYSIDSSSEIFEYIKLRTKKDKEIQNAKKLEFTFLKEMINYLILTKGIYEKSDYSYFFKDYKNNPNLLTKNNPNFNYMEHIQAIENIIDGITKESSNENDVVIFIESLIHIYGYQLMKLNNKRFAEISTLKSFDERKQKIIDYYTKFLESEIVKIKNEQDFKLDNIFNYIKEILNEQFEIIYLKRKIIYKKLVRFNKFREKIEHYLNYHYFIDFDKELYLEYNFLYESEKKTILDFYKNLQKAAYPELKLKNVATHQSSKNVKHNGVHFNLRERFMLDKELMNNLSSINIQENLVSLAKSNPMQDIFRFSRIEQIYSRPTLFSEKFRDIELTFNPNLSKKELNEQFNAIIDAYQSNVLKNKSIYEVLDVKFNAWVGKIERIKVSKKKSIETESRKVTDLLNKIQNILYVYDANKEGMCIMDISYETKESERTVQTMLYFAKYLIENDGWKLLLTSQKD